MSRREVGVVYASAPPPKNPPPRGSSGRLKSEPEFIVAGSKVYARCQTCGALVRVNKPLLGSLHICD